LAFWRGLLGAIGGAIRRGFERGVRFLTELVRFGRPAPTAEMEEEVRAVREVVQTMAPHEALEALAEWGTLETHHEAARILGERPYGVIVDPDRLPMGPFRWREAKAGAHIELTFWHPLIGDWVTVSKVYKFSTPVDIGKAIDELIETIRKTDPDVAMGTNLTWRLTGISKARE